MLYLVWLILNFTLGVYFLIICVNAWKLIGKKMSARAQLVFTIGLLSFISLGGKKAETSPNVKILWKSGTIESQQENIVKGSKRVRIYKNLVFSTWLNVDYKIEDGIKKPFRIFCSVNGVTGPSYWETLNISLYEIDKTIGKYSYLVNGSVVNRLLLIRFLETSDIYSGVFMLD